MRNVIFSTWLSCRLNTLVAAIAILTANFGQSQTTFLGDDLLQGRDKVTLPFQYTNGFIIVPIKLNGLLALNFIIDTGASHTLLFDKSYAKLMGASLTDTIDIKGADLLAEIEGYIVRDAIFQIPSLDTAIERDYIALSEDFTKLEENIGIPINGILGSDFFKRLTLKIDYCRHKITLSHPNTRPIMLEGWSMHPLEVIEGKPYIVARLDLGNKIVQAKLLLDTGASTSIILRAGKSSDITIPATTMQGVLGIALGGAVVGHLGVINQIEISDLALTDVVTNFQMIKKDTTKEQSWIGSGLIGNLVLDKFDIVLDYIHGQVYLKANKHFDEKISQDKSGIILRAYGQNLDQYMVDFIIPKSAAALSGIQKGDLILKIGRHKSANTKLHKLVSILKGKSGKVINLTLLRNEIKLHKKMVLSSYPIGNSEH